MFKKQKKNWEPGTAGSLLLCHGGSGMHLLNIFGSLRQKVEVLLSILFITHYALVPFSYSVFVTGVGIQIMIMIIYI